MRIEIETLRYRDDEEEAAKLTMIDLDRVVYFRAISQNQTAICFVDGTVLFTEVPYEELKTVYSANSIGSYFFSR